LPWQQCLDKYDRREYQDDVKVTANAFYASKKIIVIPEQSNSSPEFDKAFELFAQSKRIIILGFGYNEKNIQRLQLHRLKGIDIRGTAFNFGEAELGQLKKRCPNLVSAHPSYNIDKFFKHVVRLE
jgi:hypothetical protein